MRCSTLILLSLALLIGERGDVEAKQIQLKIPALMQSPLFKSGLPLLSGPPAPPSPPNLSPFPSPPSNFQQSFQLDEPAPVLTASPQSCTVTLLHRSFSNSYGSPSYFSFDPSAFSSTPCSYPNLWTGLTLDLYGETQGRQFDRLGTVWIGNNETGQGVEVWRFDNPEPTRTGVYWEIRKDQGKYWSLWSQRGDVVVDLPNIVDSTYTGALNVTLSLTASVGGSVPTSSKRRHKALLPALPLSARAPDQVLPLSKRLQTQNSVFLVGGSAGNGTTLLTFPSNTARAVVEIYASGTASEEFWYTGIPNQFYSSIPNAASEGYFGNGTYREVQLYIDNQFAGFATPYPVIFTGGINPLLWRPMANYGTFDQPTYNIDITPWLGMLTDGKVHRLKLAVVSSEDGGGINDASWFVSGNVQVYLDEGGGRTEGGVVERVEGAEFVRGSVSGVVEGDPTTNGTLRYRVGLEGERKFSVTGKIRTSSGEYTVGWQQGAEYSNRGFVNATSQVNEQRSYGWTRSLVSSGTNFSLDDLSGEVGVVEMKYNYPLTVSSFLSNTSFDAEVSQSFDRTISSHPNTKGASREMVGDETTFVRSPPVAAVGHTVMVGRKSKAKSVLENGAITGGSGVAEESFMYRDMAGGTIDRVTRTNTTNVLEDRLRGGARGRAQPRQLVVT